MQIMSCLFKFGKSHDALAADLLERGTVQKVAQCSRYIFGISALALVSVGLMAGSLSVLFLRQSRGDSTAKHDPYVVSTLVGGVVGLLASMILGAYQALSRTGTTPKHSELTPLSCEVPTPPYSPGHSVDSICSDHL